MTKTALILCANGTEEIELVTVADFLRRAEIDVTIASIHNTDPITCSRNVKIVPDCSLASIENKLFDVIVLPGGLAGTQAFCKSELAAKIVKKHDINQKYIAAICAAPLALKQYGICNYKYLTSHPSVKSQLLADTNYQYKEDRVVIDENLITSRGPGTAFEFAIAIAETILGNKVKVSSIISPLILKGDDKNESNKHDE